VDDDSDDQVGAPTQTRCATKQKRGPGKLLGLQVGRGVAALLVVCCHATLSAQAFYGEAFGGFWSFGNIGVDFFFVLSGFIIYYAHHSDGVGLSSWSRYAKKRIIRIYSPFLPVSLVMLAAYALATGLSHGSREIGVIPSILLIPTGRSPALSPAWTLMHEMLFYTVFSLWFYSRRAFFRFSVLWTIGIFAYAFVPGDHATMNFLLNPHNSEFVVGMVISWLVAKGYRGNLSALLFGVISVAVYAVASYLVDIDQLFGSSMLEVLYLGTAFGLVVWGLCGVEAVWKVRFPSALIFLGAASYSVYLVHDPAISLLSRVAALVRQSYAVPNDVLFLVVVCGATLAGVLYHLIWEKPVLRFLTKVIVKSAAPKWPSGGGGQS